MPEKSVIIIGAGLSAGCYARMNGYKTRILEHHSKPGGGVPSCLYSGKHVAQLLCHKDKKQFVSHKD